MITEKLENIIKKYNIKDKNKIIYGTNIPMPESIIITPSKTHIKFEKSEYYFFEFNEKGITIYPIDGEDYAIIFWDEIVDLKISHILILGKMTIKTNTATYKFQLNRFVIGCPWIKTNTKYLEQNNYFYKK